MSKALDLIDAVIRDHDTHLLHYNRSLKELNAEEKADLRALTVSIAIFTVGKSLVLAIEDLAATVAANE